jgi:hypothetical protein
LDHPDAKDGPMDYNVMHQTDQPKVGLKLNGKQLFQIYEMGRTERLNLDYVKPAFLRGKP